MNSITQNIILASDIPKTIPIHRFPRRQLGAAARSLAELDPALLGIAVHESSSGAIELMALATPTEVFLISMEPGIPNKFLSDLPMALVGFGMARLAVLLYREFQFHIRGVDLTTLGSGSTKKPWTPSKLVSERLSPAVNRFTLDSLWDGEGGTDNNISLRAWISASVAERCKAEVDAAVRVDTQWLNKAELACLAKLLTESDLLRKAKPRETESEFSRFDWSKQGDLNLHNARYRNRVRRSDQTAVVMTNTDGREFVGQARGARGKATSIKFTGKKFSGDLQRVLVVGREAPTNSERSRDEFILLLLRGERRMGDSRLIHLLWFPTSRRKQSQTKNAVSLLPITNLNDSQREVASAMLDATIPLVVAHGPPGTGKTTTISAAVELWANNNQPVWIVAHSNVAVKNIAESLFRRGVDFKILVSKEFYIEWHEHIYTRIESMLIRSDELPDDLRALERMIGGSHVVLSTLSMLSNPVLEECGVYTLVPVERLVIDEASQINVFEYMHIFHKFKHLEKVCFFGDPNQLPPYGKETAPTLQSVFDMDHLQSQAYFLDTQYRMPVPLGNFISQEVYNGRLRSAHQIDVLSCVAFVDTSKGSEVKGGFSWKNMEEIQTIVHLVRYYYRNKNFCVITPYDAQRAAIERQLKDEDLPWEHVYNVDSFQGNEADYVLISVVRTSGPGFLTSVNRMNVMLTRCRAGMVIVTSRTFLEMGGQRTLLGRLSQHWGRSHGQTKTWVDWKLVADERADMPGALGRNRADVTTTVTRPSSYMPKPLSINYSVNTGVTSQSLSQDKAWRDEYEKRFPPLPENLTTNSAIPRSSHWSCSKVTAQLDSASANHRPKTQEESSRTPSLPHQNYETSTSSGSVRTVPPMSEAPQQSRPRNDEPQLHWLDGFPSLRVAHPPTQNGWIQGFGVNEGPTTDTVPKPYVLRSIQDPGTPKVAHTASTLFQLHYPQSHHRPQMHGSRAQGFGANGSHATNPSPRSFVPRSVRYPDTPKVTPSVGTHFQPDHPPSYSHRQFHGSWTQGFGVNGGSPTNAAPGPPIPQRSIQETVTPKVAHTASTIFQHHFPPLQPHPQSHHKPPPPTRDDLSRHSGPSKSPVQRQPGTKTGAVMKKEKVPGKTSTPTSDPPRQAGKSSAKNASSSKIVPPPPLLRPPQDTKVLAPSTRKRSKRKGKKIQSKQ